MGRVASAAALGLMAYASLFVYAGASSESVVPDIFEQFNQWAEFHLGDTTEISFLEEGVNQEMYASAEYGAKLAQKRLEALHETAHADPQKAVELSDSFPFHHRREELADAVKENVEENVGVVAEFTVAEAIGIEHFLPPTPETDKWPTDDTAYPMPTPAEHPQPAITGAPCPCACNSPCPGTCAAAQHACTVHEQAVATAKAAIDTLKGTGTGAPKSVIERKLDAAQQAASAATAAAHAADLAAQAIASLGGVPPTVLKPATATITPSAPTADKPAATPVAPPVVPPVATPKNETSGPPPSLSPQEKVITKGVESSKRTAPIPSASSTSDPTKVPPSKAVGAFSKGKLKAAPNDASKAKFEDGMREAELRLKVDLPKQNNQCMRSMRLPNGQRCIALTSGNRLEAPSIPELPAHVIVYKMGGMLLCVLDCSVVTPVTPEEADRLHLPEDGVYGKIGDKIIRFVSKEQMDAYAKEASLREQDGDASKNGPDTNYGTGANVDQNASDKVAEEQERNAPVTRKNNNKDKNTTTESKNGLRGSNGNATASATGTGTGTATGTATGSGTTTATGSGTTTATGSGTTTATGSGTTTATGSATTTATGSGTTTATGSATTTATGSATTTATGSATTTATGSATTTATAAATGSGTTAVQQGSSLVPNAPTPPKPIPTNDHTHGRKKFLLIPVEWSTRNGFKYTESVVREKMQQVADWISKASYGMMSLEIHVSRPVTLPKPVEWYASSQLNLNSMLDHAREGSGLNPDNYDFDCAFFKHSAYWGWAGLASVRAKGMWINGPQDQHEAIFPTLWNIVMAHEFGHNMGLRHSGEHEEGAYSEYGDERDVMGGWRYWNQGLQYQSAHKRYVGWIPEDDYKDYPLDKAVKVNEVIQLDDFTGPEKHGFRGMRIQSVLDPSIWYYAGYNPDYGCREYKIYRLQDGSFDHRGTNCDYKIAVHKLQPNTKSELVGFLKEDSVWTQPEGYFRLTAIKPQVSDPSLINMRVESVLPSVSVTIVSGQNLRAADATGKSDPYAEIAYGDGTFPKEATYKIKAIQSTVNPNWNVEIPPWAMKDGCWVQVWVYDQDANGQFEPLGTVAIRDVNSMEGSKTITRNLEGQGAGQGKVTLKVTVQ